MFNIILENKNSSSIHYLSKKIDICQAFNRSWIEDKVYNPNNDVLESFPTVQGAFVFCLTKATTNHFKSIVSNNLYNFDILVDDVNNVSTAPILIASCSNGQTVFNNAIIGKSTTTTPSVDIKPFVSGDSIKRYRKGEAVDWVELAKKYGGNG